MSVDNTTPQYRLACQANMRGEVCGKCGKPFEPGETAYVRRVETRWPAGKASLYFPFAVPECRDCHPAASFVPRPKDKYYYDHRGTMLLRWLSHYEHREGPCVGCGRPVVYRPGDYAHTLHFYCSQRCLGAYYRNRKKEPLERACAVCGRTFTPPRRDARTCSPACRQKAYRRRVTGKRIATLRHADP
jgi:hypothetical protein